MKKPSNTLLAIALTSSLGVAACGDDPPAPAELRARISNDLGHVLTESMAATEGTSDGLPGLETLGVLERAVGISSEDGIGARLQSGMRASFDGEEPGADPQQIIDELNATLFADANHLGDGIYRVPAELVCTTTDFDPNGNDIETIDAECAQQLELAELRIRVESDDDLLRFAIQLGPDHDEPLVISLTHDSLAQTVNLDEAGHAMATLAPLFGEPAVNADLAGQVTAMVEVLGTAHIRGSLEIDRALDIAVAEAGADLDGPDAFRLTSAAARVFSIELDGSAGVGGLALDLGATTLRVPGEDGFDLDLGGASFDVDLANGQPFTVTNIGLGDRTTKISKGGAQALAIDVNPADGRRLDMTITDGAGIQSLEVFPRLDVQIAVDHAVLGDPAPVYDVTRVQLEGALIGSETSDVVRVQGGSFAITTNPASYGFAAAAGQCVASEPIYDETTGDYYTQWSVATCQ
ncbi:MAG: hypothetical protein AB7O24_23610 [Kofleriaceae bacterium]